LTEEKVLDGNATPQKSEQGRISPFTDQRGIVIGEKIGGEI
jgi:hypothetical protein